MFTKKKERVKFLRGVAYATGECHNIGDVAELEPELARAVITSGTAEATADAVGPAPTPYEIRACIYCGAPNSQYCNQCEECRRPLPVM